MSIFTPNYREFSVKCRKGGRKGRDRPSDATP